MCHFQISFLVSSLSSHPLHRVFCKASFKILSRWIFSNYFISWTMLLVSSLRTYLYLDPKNVPQTFPYVFHSKSYTDLHFTFKSIIHFELIFVYGVRFSFILLPMDAPVPFIEKVIRYWIVFALLSKSVGGGGSKVGEQSQVAVPVSTSLLFITFPKESHKQPENLSCMSLVWHKF